MPWRMVSQTLFMSKETKDKLDEGKFQTGTAILGNLRFPVNFERFLGSKTSSAVSDWMLESIAVVNIETDGFN